MKNLRLKRVMRWDRSMRMLRLFRFMWEHGTPGQPGGYGAKLSLAVWPRLFAWSRD